MSGPWEKYGGTDTLQVPGPWTKYSSASNVPLQNITAPEPQLFSTPAPASFFQGRTPEGDQSSFVDKAVGAFKDPLGFVEDAPGTRFVPVVTPALELGRRLLPEGKVKQAVTGAQEGVGDVAESVTSPGSLSMIASGGGLASIAPKLTSLGFSGLMGYETAKGAKETYQQAKQGNVEGAVRSGVGTLASGAGTILPLKGIVETEAVPRKIGPKGEDVSDTQIRQPGTIGKGTQAAVERNKERGAIPRNIFTDYLTKEKDLRSGYTLEGPLVLLDPKVSGFASQARPAAEQMVGRLENLSKQGRVSPVEVQVYKDAGLNEFLATRPTVKETAQWMQDNGPKVEVRKFGGGSTKAQASFAQFQHQADTLGVDLERIGDRVRLRRGGVLLTPESMTPQELAVYSGLNENLLPSEREQSNPNTSHWQSIAPKSEADMPGYVELAVTKPQQVTKENTASRGSGYRQGGQWVTEPQFPSTHSFPPNTLAFGRGYMEPIWVNKNTGEISVEKPLNNIERWKQGKSFHVIEVQSDWAADVAKRKAVIERAPGRVLDSMMEHDKQRLANLQDPLLHDYNRLALKALIEHARNEGADAIAVSDAETGMMTEGHDRQGRVFDIDTTGKMKPAELYAKMDELEKGINGGYLQKIDTTKYLLKPDAPQKVIDYFKSLGYDVEPQQSKGMRLNYDTLLPRIVEELTGSKGEKVSFGEHRMAFDALDAQREAGIEPAKSRKDLIFRNPDGTPKTDVSATMFPLNKPSETPFSLFGKKTPKVEVEQEAPKGGGESTLSEADRAKSRANNSKEAWLKMNQGKLPGIGGGTPQGGERGAVTIPPAVHDIITKAVDKLQGTTKQIGDHFKRGNLREVLSYTRDATDVQPKLYARQAKNHVLNKLENVTAKENLPMARKALTFVVEAKGQIKSLDDMRKTIINSSKSSTNKKDALQAIDYARSQWNSLQQVAQTYKSFTDQQIKNEQGQGFEVPSRQGYVHHAQDIDMERGFFSSGEGEGTSFKKQRDYATYAESIAAGVKAKTIDSIDLLEHRLAVGQKMVAMKQWVDSFRTVTDPVSKSPLIAKTKIVERPDGTQYVDVPKGYTKEWMGGQVVAVHKGWEGVFSALTDPSWWSKSGTREAFQKLNATAKSTRLLFDTFHLGRIAIWNGFIRAMDLEKPNPFSYRKGKTLLDYDEATIQDMAKKGQIPKEWVKDLGEQKRIQNLLINKGLNVGRILDSLHQDWVQKIPGVIGGMNKWLFDSFQRGAMQEIARMEFDRVKKGSPGLIEDEVARRVVKDVNTRFGSLGRQGLLKSKTAQDHARLLVLAPQWNEALIRSELGAMKQTGEFVYNKVMGEKIASGLLMRSVGGLLVGQFMANQLINLYTRGYPTWDNKEEGIGAKLSAFIPDKLGSSSGFFLHPAGLAAETTHLITTRWEKSGSLRTAIQDYVKGRKSSLDDLVAALWTGDTKDVVPFPIPTGAAVSLYNKYVPKEIPLIGGTGELKEDYPGAVERQMLSSSGVKTDLVPSPHQRIARLAREFNEKQGIVHKQEPSSDYQGLNEALRVGDMKEAQKQLDELKKTKPLATLIKYYAQEYPKELFTGKKEREHAFENSLSPDDKDLYQKVLEERKTIARKGLNLVRGPSRFSAFEEDEQPQQKPWEKYK
jgi:hypothetical protein